MDLIDLDELTKDDSFYLPSGESRHEDDITNILQQWKNDGQISQDNRKSIKVFDTRTFTRPKRKSANSPFGNQTNETILSNSPPTINLQIGGLVSSRTSNMTNSRTGFLDNISPPSSVCSGIDVNERMLSSLVTSNDFSNIDFLQDMGDNETLSNIDIDGYTLNTVISDRQFLENLNDIDNNTLSKDSQLSKADTFKMQETFDKDIDSDYCTVPLVDESQLMSITQSIEQVNDNQLNETFDAKNVKNRSNIFKEVKSSTFDMGHPEGLLNVTMDYVKSNSVIASDVASSYTSSKTGDLQANSYTKPLGNLQTEKHSTPQRGSFQSRRSITTIHELSPIENKCLKESTASNIMSRTMDIEPINSNRTRPAFDRLDSLEAEIVYRSRSNMNDTVVLERERESLKNFEEFEKSLSNWDDANKNEEEFNDMLNKLGGFQLSSGKDKIRQSLDNIKKRHSLALSEKCDVERTSKESKEFLNQTATLSDSMKMSTSSGERLLSRRSRLFEDAQDLPVSNNEQKNNVMNETLILTDMNNESAQQIEDAKEKERKIRDRFKTIKIFKSSSNEFNIPDADATNINVGTSQENSEAANGHGVNDRNNIQQVPIPVSNTVTEFVKPKPVMRYQSKLARPDTLKFGFKSLKSSSTDSLESKSELGGSRESMIHVNKVNSNYSNLKSPLGIKAKSVHNIAQTGLRKVSQPAQAVPLKTHVGTIYPTLKLKKPTIPGVVPVVDSKMKAPATSKLTRPTSGLVRPSTAYYGYGNKKQADSDGESGRFSPSNSLSSSSSKSNISKQDYSARTEILSQPSIDLPEEISIPPATVTATNTKPSRLARPSCLRPPTSYSRQSALPRPSTAYK